MNVRPSQIPTNTSFSPTTHSTVGLIGMAIIKTYATFPFLYRPVKETDSC